MPSTSPLLILALGFHLSQAASSQEPSEGPASVAQHAVPVEVGADAPVVSFDAWKGAHGDTWRILQSQRTGRMEMIFGGAAEPPFVPDTYVEEDWVDLARHWIGNIHALHGVEDAQLTRPRFRFLPLGQWGTTDKITVRLHQEVDGIPVENGAINALFDTSGRLLSLHCTAAESAALSHAEPTIDEGMARLIAAAAFKDECGAEPSVLHSEGLVYAHVRTQEGWRWPLTWQVETFEPVQGGRPVGRSLFIDAHSGSIVKSRSNVHGADVEGTVYSHATPGHSAHHAVFNMATLHPMPMIWVTASNGQQVETNALGQFSFPGLNQPVDLTVSFSGPYCKIGNLGSLGDFNITFPNVAPNQHHSLKMYTGQEEQIIAQANAHRYIVEVGNYIRRIMPTDTTADFVAFAEVNSPPGPGVSTCGGVFRINANPARVVLGTSGFVPGPAPQVPCGNASFSSYVAHEFGHWLNILYGIPNDDDGLGEGNADVFAMYLLDDPCIFADQPGPDLCQRTGDNVRPFCGDLNQACHTSGHGPSGGAPPGYSRHDDGEVWMGAAWKVRQQLKGSLGAVAGGLTADALFVGWMNSFNQTSIHSIIEIQWLCLDDDDGNISNGTPNYAAINAGFVAQGFPGFPLEIVAVTGVTPPASLPATGPFTIHATASTTMGSSISSADLLYRINEGSTVTVPMSFGGNDFSGTIPFQSAAGRIRYAVLATDNLGNTGVFPLAGIENGLVHTVGSELPILVEEFEWTSTTVVGCPAPTSWCRSDSASGGGTLAGRWTVGDPIGAPGQSEEDASPNGSKCAFTGAAYETMVYSEDVDYGQVWLTSPQFDASGAQTVLLSYALWYSNDVVGWPVDDECLVCVSNDGGSSWAPPILTLQGSQPGGWKTRHVNLADVFAPADLTATMMVRFEVGDLGQPSRVEAAVDEVRIVRF